MRIPRGNQPSVMSHQFSQVPHADIPRSRFKRSHGHKTTFNSGLLIPIYVDEALPGDTFSLNMSSIARLMTPMRPIMDNIYLDFHFFAVPNRLLWDNWQKFMGERQNPDDSTDYLVPQVSLTPGAEAGSLADYFGIPTGVDTTVNALHFRAYNLIWNEWFRDQNLQDSAPVPTDDGPDDIATDEYELRRRGKRHDYFTSCLPWPQKGPGVELPLGDSAPVIGNGITMGLTDGTHYAGMVYNTPGNGVVAKTNAYGQDVNFASSGVSEFVDYRSIGLTDEASHSGLIADLSSATAATINSLREAFQLQKLMERDARGGTRYTEIIRSHFRVTSPDQRLQRPEYLGGGSRPLEFQPVPNTNFQGLAPGPQNFLGAQSFTQSSGIGFTKSFVEHSVIIGLVSVRADLTYQRGINRMWSRQTRYDYYWPALAHLGEQEVLNKEIFAQGTDDDDQVFGYQERWSEYRYAPSLITGLMRSVHEQSLDIWHVSQDFDQLPELNESFVEEHPPIERISAVSGEDHFKADFYFDINCTRPMPVYSVPGLIDHF